MILEQLMLQNFCLYCGEQTFDLSPVGRERPVILIGGLNGGGKTTILDAVQLALYGPRAQISKRQGTSYDQFLRACIHRGVDAKDGASICLRFSYVAEGQRRQYEVRRSWSVRRKHLRESVSVFMDGELDRHLSDHWNDVVEELIPLGISRLFFFDAEQVRFLADDESSDVALGAAVKSLLGLDLAERLIADASVLETRLAERVTSVADNPAHAELLEQQAAIENEFSAKHAELAALENSRLRAEEAKRLADERFAEAGGEHWLQRGAKKKDLQRAKEIEQQIRSDLVRLAATELPFALVSDLIDEVDRQDRLELAGNEAAIVQSVLSKRDQKVIKRLRAQGIDDQTVKLVKQVQQQDRAERRKAVTTSVRHGLSDTARTTVRHLHNGALHRQLDQSAELLRRLEKVCGERERLERSLKMTPDDASLAEVFEQLKIATEEATVLNGQAKRLEGELSSLRSQRDELDRKIRMLQRKQVEADIESEKAARMVKLAVRTQETMREFLRQSTIRKIGRLSQLVGEAFQFLLRKQTLVERVEIDPHSFRITLYDTEGGALPKERLSEGEKQIFAISVLWGLAKASPRPLPVIVDTPMARLDTEHRAHLVERYFPHASHQVIVLSTDAEVDRRCYEKLRASVSHAFRLNYDEQAKRTVVEDGYFAEI